MIMDVLAREQKFINSSVQERPHTELKKLNDIRFAIPFSIPDILRGMFNYLNEKRAVMKD
ncbi:hypothetical protein [Acidovorax sp. FHTAMBA]|uniref:hypothetical protein n=1 Tax=Acidovorax sp. FHTAMBA TaxID=3140252 RepID=UPI0031836133